MPHNGSAHNLRGSPAWVDRENQGRRQIRKAALSVRVSHEMCAAEPRSHLVKRPVRFRGLLCGVNTARLTSRSPKQTARRSNRSRRDGRERPSDGHGERACPQAAHRYSWPRIKFAGAITRRGSLRSCDWQSRRRTRKQTEPSPELMPHNGEAHNLQTSPAKPLRETEFYARWPKPRFPFEFSNGICAAESVPSSSNCLSGSGACYTAGTDSRCRSFSGFLRTNQGARNAAYSF